MDDLWHAIAPEEDFPLRPRMSRIHHRGKSLGHPRTDSTGDRRLSG